MDLLEKLKEKHGGYWGEHSKYFLTDWRYAIENNETRQGYWEWVFDQLETERI